MRTLVEGAHARTYAALGFSHERSRRVTTKTAARLPAWAPPPPAAPAGPPPRSGEE